MVMWLLTSRITWHVSSGHYFFTHIDNMYTVSPPPKKEQYFVHNFDKFKCVVMISGTQHRKSNAKLPIQLWSTSPNQCCYFALQNEVLCVLACCTTMSERTKRKKTAVVFKFAGFKSSWWISVGNIKYNVPDVCCLSGCLKHRLKWNSIPSWIMLPSLQQPHCIDLIVSCRCISRPVLDILNTASGSNIVHHWPHDQLRSVIYLFLALDTYWCGIQWHTFLFPRQSSTILLGEEHNSSTGITFDSVPWQKSQLCIWVCQRYVQNTAGLFLGRDTVYYRMKDLQSKFLEETLVLELLVLIYAHFSLTLLIIWEVQAEIKPKKQFGLISNSL